LPLRVTSLSVRRGSGGRGKHRGGDGLVKAVTATSRLSVSFLGERHEQGPPGADGGSPGKPGRLWRQHGRSRQRMAAKCSFVLERGDSVIVETPGGGGHGRA
jgi:N-methylhydantoinase B/oxoprolinase/acetone carboxylase alpha subunit